MKRSFLDKAYISPDLVDAVDESSLYENTGVDYSRVRNGVYERLKLRKPKAKRNTLRKILIAAAAAVVIVGMFSLPVVAENVYMLYCSIVGGDSYALELENAKDAHITVSDPDLQVDSVKIGGDACGANIIDIRVSRKNGKKFTDGSLCTVKPCRFNAYCTSMGDPDEKNVHDLEAVIEDDSSDIKGLGSKALYEVENNGKTLHILIYLTAEGKTDDGVLRGKKIRITSNSYAAASVEKVLKSYEDMSDKNLISAMKLQTKNKKPVPYDIFTNSYAYTDIVYVSDHFELVEGHIKTYSLPFEIEFTMDHDVSMNTAELDTNTLYSIFGNKQSNGTMNVSPFSFSINAVNDGTHDGEKIRFEPESCYVTTKDGKKYYLVADGCGYEGKRTVIKCVYGLFPNNNNGNSYNSSVCIADVRNIEKIVFNGITVYFSE